MTTKRKPVIVGSVVAFNNLPDAAWFEVLKKNGDRIEIREHGTDYAVQHHFASCVKQVR